MDESDLGNAGMMSSFMMPHPAIWQAQYRCFAASELQGKSQEILDLINYGGKGNLLKALVLLVPIVNVLSSVVVILPQSALTTLMNRTGSGPILFSIERYELDDEPIVTYTSVLEFVAEEGRIYIPGWVHWALIPLNNGLLLVNNLDDEGFKDLEWCSYYLEDRGANKGRFCEATAPKS